MARFEAEQLLKQLLAGGQGFRGETSSPPSYVNSVGQRVLSWCLYDGIRHFRLVMRHTGFIVFFNPHCRGS